MPTIPEQLDALAPRDSFNRAAESPMERPEWTKLPWVKTAGRVGGFSPVENMWIPKSLFSEGEDGAYWNVEEYLRPAVRVKLGGNVFTAERWIAVWVACDPASHNGYRLKLVSLETEKTTTGPGKHEYRVEKVSEGTVTKLAGGTIEGARGDQFGLTLIGGVLKAWRKIDAAGEWVELASVADTTYSSGRSGIEGKGLEEHAWDEFCADSLEAEEVVGEGSWDVLAQGFNNTGAWLSTTEYHPYDVVTRGGSSYVCIKTHKAQEPPNATYWDVLAEKGAAGTSVTPGFKWVFGEAAPAAAGQAHLALIAGAEYTLELYEQPENGWSLFAYIEKWAVGSYVLVDDGTTADRSMFKIVALPEKVGAIVKMKVIFEHGKLPSGSFTVMYLRV